jgi:hypothetical protein
VQSESKWKQLGELAMSSGKVLLYDLNLRLAIQDFSLIYYLNVLVCIEMSALMMYC